MEREDSNWREKTKRVNNWRTIICMTLVALNPPAPWKDREGREQAAWEEFQVLGPRGQAGGEEDGVSTIGFLWFK